MTPRKDSASQTVEDTNTDGDARNTREVHSGNTLESYVLPKSLKMHSFDVNFMTSGMEVIKVSKVGVVMIFGLVFTWNVDEHVFWGLLKLLMSRFFLLLCHQFS